MDGSDVEDRIVGIVSVVLVFVFIQYGIGFSVEMVSLLDHLCFSFEEVFDDKEDDTIDYQRY